MKEYMLYFITSAAFVALNMALVYAVRAALLWTFGYQMSVFTAGNIGFIVGVVFLTLRVQAAHK